MRTAHKNPTWYDTLAQRSMTARPFTTQTLHDIFDPSRVELLPLLNAAFTVRKKFCGTNVTIHILNNAQNGHCCEDCSYCAQSKRSTAPIVEYPLKSDEEIIAEAEAAYKSGAFRYCMVFSGRTQSEKRIAHLATLVKEIKRKYPIEVCVSPGVITETQARTLKAAGLDRLNHNINTSKRLYPQICTTHTYAERIATLDAAQNAGLAVCCGVIIGMGETVDDMIDMARTLHQRNVDSLPVNFFIPIEGVALKNPPALTADFCLRALCLFRFLNPRTEIRVAAGRELHLRDLEVLAFYPANSLFMDGYLNAQGTSRQRTLTMLRDAGFTIQSEFSLDELLRAEEESTTKSLLTNGKPVLKKLTDLRPKQKCVNK